MSVDYHNPQYTKHLKQWRRCDDTIEGSDAVKDQGPLYLPMLSGQDNKDYRSYKERSLFFNAVGRTVDALSGLVNAKPAVFSGPEAVKELMKDITLSGITMGEFANEVLEKVIGNGRCGVLVDFPKTDTSNMTMAETKALNLRPYARIYRAVHITDWRSQWVGGKEILTLVILQERECSYNGRVTEWTDRRRVLEINADGYYQQTVEHTDKDGNNVTDTVYAPKMGGRMMREIPFRFINVETSRSDCETPPLLDLVDTNIAHYRNSADYEHGLHFTGLPQPYVSGVQLDDGKTLNIGSPNAWVFTDPQAKASYLEFTGQGLRGLADAIAAKERKMAVLGARMLADEKAAAEAVEAIEMRFSGENSVLTSIANSVSLGMTWMLQKMAQWDAIAGYESIRYTLNTDYNLKQMQPQMILALMQAWQNGLITHETAVEVMQKGEVVGVWENIKAYVAKLTAQNEKKASAEGPSLMSGLRSRMGL